MTTKLRPRTLESMPAHARLWVYKSASAFTPAQEDLIASAMQEFIGGWTAHNHALDAWGGTVEGHFVVIAVDQEQAVASGCGIDKSVRFIQDLEQAAGVRLTDRMVVLYEHAQGLRATRVDRIAEAYRAGELSDDTIVRDDLVTTKGDMDGRFRVRLADSWLARFR